MTRPCRQGEGGSQEGASLVAQVAEADGALRGGFNPNVEFRRTRTIMQGATHGDFDYRRTE